MKSPSLIMLLALVTATVSGASPDRSHYVDYDISPIRDSDYGITFDWQSHGPKELLEVLRVSDGCFMATGVHYSWIHQEDIPYLISVFGSEEPCAVVQSPSCSRLPTRNSTIGHEAKLMVEAFRRGRYPYFLSSEGVAFSNMEAHHFDQWCKRFSEYIDRMKGEPGATDNPDGA